MTKTTAFTLSVTLALTVATPTITPNGGNFSGSVSVAMQTATSGASIYYTTDGSTPSQSSQLYTGAMNVTSDTTINAEAFKSGYNPSSVASASFTLAAIAQSTTGNAYYVATNGSDSDSGTIKQPFRTIRQGIASLAAGDTLYIRSGTYNERIDGSTIPSGTGESNRTKIVAADGPGTVIIFPMAVNNNGLLGWPNSGSFQYITFDGIIFDGTNVVGVIGSDSMTQVIYIPGEASHLRFTNVEVRNGGMANLNAQNTTTVGFTSSGSNVEFLNCHVHHNGLGPSSGPGSQGARGYAWYIPGGSDILIDNCDVHDSGGYAVHSYSGTPHWPMRVTVRNSRFWGNGVVTAQFQLTAAIRAINSTVYNNLVYNNGSIGIESVAGDTTSIIYNNTVYGNGSWGILVSNAIVKNNITYNNSLNRDGSADIGGFNLTGSVTSNNLCGQTYSTPGACAVVGNPKFVDTATGDFHLQGGSPAIDAAVTLIEAATDIAGTPRPQGAAYDIGAFEYR